MCVGGATAVYVSSVLSSDALSTARLLSDAGGRRTCSLTAAAAVNAACEPLLSLPSCSTAPTSDADMSTSAATCRRLRDSGIAFIDEDDRI